MELSKVISKKAVFMGLFDAVDRSDEMDVRDFLSNQNHPKTVYHALRKDSSRISFGNAVRVDDRESTKYPWYHQRAFNTSHGGTGGAIDFSPREPLHDYSCSTELTLDPKYAFAVGAVGFALVEITTTDYRKKRAENCIQESMAADSWIREGATLAGLTFDGTEMQSIMYDKGDGHIKKR